MKVLCFSCLRDPSLFDLVEFYREDIAAFTELGLEVEVESVRRRAILHHDADLLYAWWGATAFPVVAAWRIRGRKCILTGAVGRADDGTPPIRRRLRLALVVLASKLANRTLAVSDLELRDLRTLGVRNATLAYHSVDTEYFAPVGGGGTRGGITVGQLNAASIERKGIDVAIAATPLIRSVVPDYELTVAGPIAPDGKRWLEEARRRTDFTGINIVGRVTREEKRDLLRSGYVYLQPSTYEAFGVAVVEAMACGTPPVHTEGGALTEVVGGAGVPVVERTARGLADAVIELVSQPQERARLSVMARERSLTFSRARRRRVLGEAVEEVLNGTSKPHPRRS